MITILTTALFMLAAAVSIVAIAHALAVHGRKALDLSQQLEACRTTQELRFTITEFRSIPAPSQVIRPDFRSRQAAKHPAPLRAAA